MHQQREQKARLFRFYFIFFVRSIRNSRLSSRLRSGAYVKLVARSFRFSRREPKDDGHDPIYMIQPCKPPPPPQKGMG